MPGPSSPASSTEKILYTIKVKKAEIYTMGRGSFSTTGRFAPGRAFDLPTVETFLNGTYVVTTPNQQDLAPSAVTESKEDFTVTGTLHSRTNPPLNPEAELAVFKRNNMHNQLGEQHYEFVHGEVNHSAFKMFTQAPAKSVVTIQSQIKKTLSALTIEHIGRSLNWCYNGVKNCAWLTDATEDELNRIKTYLKSADIQSRLTKTSADNSLILMIDHVPVDQLQQLTNREYDRIAPS